MITTFKVIQIILFALFIIPSIYGLIKEPFFKSPKNRKSRCIINVGIILISTLIFIILSIVITSIDDTYNNMNFAAFQQMLIIIKSVLAIYLQITMILILISGFIAIYILATNCSYSCEQCYIVREEDVKYLLSKLTTFDKIFKYPHFYLDCSVIIKRVEGNDPEIDDYIIGFLGYKEMLKLLKKESKKSGRTKR